LSNEPLGLRVLDLDIAPLSESAVAALRLVNQLAKQDSNLNP